MQTRSSEALGTLSGYFADTETGDSASGHVKLFTLHPVSHWEKGYPISLRVAKRAKMGTQRQEVDRYILLARCLLYGTRTGTLKNRAVPTMYRDEPCGKTKWGVAAMGTPLPRNVFV